MMGVGELGIGELLASAAFKQISGMLGTATWKAIASQLGLGDELQALNDTVDSIHEDLLKSEERLMKDGNVRIWMRELKEAALDMEDMIMKFEGDILKNRDGSHSNKSTTKISIPLKLRLTLDGKLTNMKLRLKMLRRFDSMVDTSSDDQDEMQMRATSSIFFKEGIVGRDKDKAELMKLLQEDCKHSIIPIYGLGGLGKTTLAQMVFNETRRIYFDICVWVYVSTKFSNENIGQSIISQVERRQSNQYDLSHVQKRLSGKKYLLVLDDLWEENPSNLNQLKAMLKGGAPGSKIIVTTRSQQVAKLMNRELQFKLDALPYEDCLKLFVDIVFPHGYEESDEFLEVSEKIVQKCCGIPLAVKCIGWYLRHMPWHEWWLENLDRTVSNAALQSLMISYYYMPYYLRPCFVYFAAFPKGFVIEKRDLIHRWIALGYVSTTHSAEEYLQQLLHMSFLEATSASTSISAGYSKPNNPHDSLFKMHDLVHELARSVAVEEVAIFYANNGSFGAKKDICRFMLFSNFKDGYLKCKDMPMKARAIHFSDCTGCQLSTDAFSETKWLRVLDLSRIQTVELPRSMRNLHHLQVLNLSGNTSLMKLHSSFGKKNFHGRSSICDFQKLRLLDVHGCSNLRELPGNIHILHDLEHLDLSGCTSLQKLPSRFGELQMLSFLNLSCSQLEMLPDTFSQLEHLEYLDLSFCSKLKHLHTLSFKRMKRLLYLNMSGCKWLEALPEFYGDNDGCLNLDILDLSDCDRLIELSESCARLNKLRFLSLSGCSRIQNIIHFLGKFGKLEYLNLSGVPLPGFDVRKNSESSTGNSSGYSGEDLRLKMLNGITKTMPRLKYLSAGGLSLFSKEGISEDFLTLPDFVVSTRSGSNSSNITLLNILDPTHHELNIRCLEAVMSAQEVATVEMDRKHWLVSLSLEWSSSEWFTPSEPTVKTMAVLEHLQPHKNLTQLTIKGYNHSMFPPWIMRIHDTLPNLVKLVLSDLVQCDYLPTPANLSNIEELEIRNMPLLEKAFLSPCKNLKRLSLVALASGFTLRFIQETNRNCQWIHDVELDHAEESKTPEVARTHSCNPSQENRETEQTIMKRYVRENVSALSATKEAVPTLCCLKIEYCQYMKLYLSINCEEYFINESKVEFITDTGSSTPILARTMRFKNCSHHTARLLHHAHISIHELVIDGCDKEFLNYMDSKFERVYDVNDLCDKESLNFAIQKLKITNTEEFDLEYLPCIPSLQELEIDCINEICIDSYGDSLGRLDKLKTLKRMDKLEKITLLSRENCLSTDPEEALLLDIPHIQYININEGIDISSSEVARLEKTRSHQLIELNIKDHEYLSSSEAEEIKLGEMSSTPSIIEVPTNFSLGAMGPLLRKLDSLLASGSHHQWSAKEAIKLLKEDLEEINAYLVELSTVERPNYKSRYWMHEVRELSYHIEDSIDNMMQAHSVSVPEAKIRFSGRSPQLSVRRHVKILCPPKKLKPFASSGLRRTLILSVSSSLVRHPGFLKRFSLSWRHESRHGAPLAQLHQALLLIRPPPLSARIAELRTLLWEARERHQRYQLQDCLSSEPRFLFPWNSHAPASSGAAANNLVGVDGTRGKLTSWLIEETEEEHQLLKVLSIIGPAGVGKTALVKELYGQLGHQFECRAFVRVSRNPDMRRLLGEILAQVQGHKRDYEYEAASTADDLMDRIRSHFQDKRYLVVIDELWDAAVWDIINIAFPKGNDCSRIIITAEGKDVASKCYCVNKLEMAPLGNPQDSGKIFFDRVFGSEHQCPDQLKDISYMIIRSCGGFPLAITTIASLVASQIDNTKLWEHLQQCFSSRLTGLTLEETCKEVVNICCDALPQDLKTCLLYLTMYPEGSTIRKADLLNQWIAEGFITPAEGKQAVAESYFVELINRRMIQPEKIGQNDEVLSCTVHHIVFDLIAQKCRQENFITAVDYSEAMPGFSIIARRLSLHFSCAQFAAKPEGLKLSQVRSMAFYGLLMCMPSITEFKFLRVLILEFWGNNYHHNMILDLSKLSISLHLRYLKVSSHTIIVLPSKIQRLQSLETLEIDAKVSTVPTDIVHLPSLLHLSLPNGTELPDGIGRITSLQTLEHFDLGKNSKYNVKSLSGLINLQNLHVTCSKDLSDHHLKRNLVALYSSIGKLANLKYLRVGPFAVGMTMFIGADGMPCTAKLLQRLDISPSSCIFSRLPTWIGGLQKLCILKIAIRVLLSSDIDTLTGLPDLVVLSLYVQKPNAESVIFNSGSLPALKYFKYKCAALRLAFQKEALPNLQRLKFCFNVQRAESSEVSRFAGIENLLKLKEIITEIGLAVGADESYRRAAESALKEATQKHPRFPIHINVKSVDCIQEESTQAGFMHLIPYILGLLALVVLVVLLIMLF